jgi:uncharacterized membrane protein
MTEIGPRPSPSPQVDGRSPSPLAWWERPRFWLATFVAVFFAVSFYSVSVTYLDLHQTIGNLPIFMQALSSTAHGYIPFYESQDCAGKMRCSFLIVHPSFMLYAVVPLYQTFPSALTLFALQSMGVALAAIPLYVLTRHATGSAAKGLLAAGLFLVWAPLLEGIVSSVWVESFLPLEFFTIAALWQAGRFRIGLAVALVSFLTFEVAPVLSLLLGLFFLAPAVWSSIRFGRGLWSEWRRGSASLSQVVSRWMVRVREGLHQKFVGFTLLLVLASLVAYALANIFMNVVGSSLLGITSPPIPSGLAGVFYNSSAAKAPSILTLLAHPSILLSANPTLVTAEYWLVLYGLLGFIPLLCPRALILSVPWMGFTFASLNTRNTIMGGYSPGIAAVVLFIGLAYGLSRVPLLSSAAGRETGGRDSIEFPRSTARARVPAGRPFRNRAHWMGLVIGVIVANMILSPINPALPDLHVVPGGPFAPGYFVSAVPDDSGFDSLEQMVAVIPSDATVAAPPILGPFVINDIYAYLLTNRGTPQWENDSRLPFHPSDSPDYVLVNAMGGYLPATLYSYMNNPTLYGVRGYVPSSALGAVFMYQAGYTSVATRFGPPAPAPQYVFSPNEGLTAGTGGFETTAQSAPTPNVIQSDTNATKSGPFLNGGRNFLPPGNYTFGAWADLIPPSKPGPAGAPIVNFTINEFGGARIVHSFTATAFSADQWSLVTFEFTIPAPFLFVDFGAVMLNGHYTIAVSKVMLDPTGTS